MKEDRRVQKTKKAIKEAFFQLLESNDFNQLTVNDIADAANVNRGTIYFHYEDKYDLLNKCMEEQLLLFQDVCSPINMSASADELYEYFKRVYQFFDDNNIFFSVMLQNGGASHFHEKFIDQILYEMHRIPPTTDNSYDAEFFAQFRVNALVGVVEWWIKENHPLTIEEMAKNTVQLFLKNK